MIDVVNEPPPHTNPVYAAALGGAGQNETVKGFLDKLASTGLPIYISEYDINLANDSEQQKVMERQFPLFWSHPSVRGITLWGYVRGATWRPDTGLISSSGTPRPAMAWLMKLLGR